METKLEPARAAVTPRTRHWTLFLAGTLLFVLGPALYIVQFRSKNLATPWYLPALSTAAVALMIVSVWRRPGVVRGIGLVLFTLLCGLEWFTIAVATKTPEYTGPAQPGRKVPQFTAVLATGAPFTEKDLESGSTTALVFFRGRW
jgi:hypothetical protein